MQAALRKPFGDRLRTLGADEDHVVADVCSLAPEPLVERLLLDTQLDHARRHEDPPLGPMVAEDLERRGGAGRVGVVGVVDHDDPRAHVRDRRQAVLGWLNLRQSGCDPLDRHSGYVPDGRAGEQVGDVVAPQQAGRHRCPLVVDHERECRAAVGQLDVLGAHRGVRGVEPVQDHFDALAERFGDRAHARVIAVGHERAALRQRPRQLGLGVGDRLDRAEPLQMHGADRSQDPDRRDGRAHTAR